MPGSCRRQPGNGAGGGSRRYLGSGEAGSQALLCPLPSGLTAPVEVPPEVVGAESSPERESRGKRWSDTWGNRCPHGGGRHRLFVQSEGGQKHLDKLGVVRMLGMLNAWVGPALCHPRPHNLPSPSQDFGHLSCKGSRGARGMSLAQTEKEIPAQTKRGPLHLLLFTSASTAPAISIISCALLPSTLKYSRAF